MSVDDLTYSTLFCDKVFDNDLWSSCTNLESCNVVGEYARHVKEAEAPETSTQGARERGYSYYESSSDEEENEDDELYTVDQNILILAILEIFHLIQTY